ncbi:hypothetical protein ACFRAE_17490 [Sphingobacterium sp. HJSM2_6]
MESSFLTSINYGYNERGWTDTIGSAQFTEVLNHHRNQAGAD